LILTIFSLLKYIRGCLSTYETATIDKCKNNGKTDRLKRKDLRGKIWLS